MKEIRDERGHFLGMQPRLCGKHRAWSDRAWCVDCSEWCSPRLVCPGCASMPEKR